MKDPCQLVWQVNEFAWANVADASASPPASSSGR
jgi:hypothetical protein